MSSPQTPSSTGRSNHPVGKTQYTMSSSTPLQELYEAEKIRAKVLEKKVARLESENGRLQSQVERMDYLEAHHDLTKDAKQQLESTNAELLRAQDESKDEKADLQHNLSVANGEIDTLKDKLNDRGMELSDAIANVNHIRQELDAVTRDLSVEKNANKTAGLEILLKHAEVKLDTLFKDLNDKTDRLKKESLEKTSLVKSIGRLEEEGMKVTQEKESLDNRLQEMEESLSRSRTTIRNLQTDYDAERTCLLDQLMAETVQLRYGIEELPKDFGYMGRDMQDVRVFHGKQGEETVLVRAQRFVKVGKAFFIIEKGDRTKMVWHESLVRCTVDMKQFEWYFRLDKDSNGIPIEVRIDSNAAYYLMSWQKESSKGNASSTLTI